VKKIILAVLLVVIVLTPCLAKEIEPDGLFSIEGTRWVSCWIGLSTSQPFIVKGCNSMLGFYQGTIYACVEEDNCNPLPDHIFSYAYYDLLVFTILNMAINPLYGDDSSVAIMLPCGLGVERYIGSAPGLESYIGIMFKVDNNWTPPPGVQ
jgi:hypothetical protein